MIGRVNYEGELIEAIKNAIAEKLKRVGALGENSVVGVDNNYVGLRQVNNMIMVTALGAAVVVE